MNTNYSQKAKKVKRAEGFSGSYWRCLDWLGAARDSKEAHKTPANRKRLTHGDVPRVNACPQPTLKIKCGCSGQRFLIQLRQQLGLGGEWVAERVVDPWQPFCLSGRVDVMCNVRSRTSRARKAQFTCLCPVRELFDHTISTFISHGLVCRLAGGWMEGDAVGSENGLSTKSRPCA